MRSALTAAVAAAFGLSSALGLPGARTGEIENFVRVDDRVCTGAKLAADQVVRL